MPPCSKMKLMDFPLPVVFLYNCVPFYELKSCVLAGRFQKKSRDVNDNCILGWMKKLKYFSCIYARIIPVALLLCVLSCINSSSLTFLVIFGILFCKKFVVVYGFNSYFHKLCNFASMYKIYDKEEGIHDFVLLCLIIIIFFFTFFYILYKKKLLES